MRKHPRRSSHLLSCAAIALIICCIERQAHATDATEFPDNGSEQGMRGGAWVARASDPLAAFYNPAGLAGQPTRLILQGNFGSQRTCFTRIKANNDATSDGIKDGAAYPQVCNGAGYAIDPQLAMTIRLTPRVGLGIAPLLGPSSAAGSSTYPDFATVGGIPNSPEPGRYLLISQSVILLTPTIAIGGEVLDRWRIGASFQWGIAHFSFTTASAAANESPEVPAVNDIKATLTGHDYFIPGFTLGTIWSPTDNLDVAGWYKWSNPISATGDVSTIANYYTAVPANSSAVYTSDTSQPNCGFEPKGTTPCGSGGNASIHLAHPMEAKVGVRFHMPRNNIPYDEHTRDPMAQDVFDVEVDGTWANDSALNYLYIRFPEQGNLGALPVNLGPGGLQSVVPPNADSPLHYSDVFGIRVGGDWNVLPDQLALRGGVFYQTPAQTAANQVYQSLAFSPESMVGLAIGATYRIHLGPGSNAIELSGGYEHVFVGTSSTTDGQVYGLTGTPCDGPTAGNICQGGGQRYRTPWAVNDGTITNSINVINAGLGYRF